MRQGTCHHVPQNAMLDAAALDSAVAPTRLAARWALGLGVLVVVAALASSGPVTAGGAAALGVFLGLAAGHSLVSVLRAALASPTPPDAGRRANRRAVAAALLRYPLLGAALAMGLWALGLPAGWLAAGLTAWPVSLVIAALRPSSAGAGTESMKSRACRT